MLKNWLLKIQKQNMLIFFPKCVVYFLSYNNFEYFSLSFKNMRTHYLGTVVGKKISKHPLHTPQKVSEKESYEYELIGIKSNVKSNTLNLLRRLCTY